MSKQTLLLQTEDPKEALLIRGYTFNPAPYGFMLGQKNRTVAYKVANYGSIFMNDYLERSGLPGAASFRYMFGAKRYQVGDLASCSPTIADEILRSGKTYDEADAKVLDLFLSDELSSMGMQMPCLYEVPLVTAGDVLQTVEKNGEKKMKIKGDDKPFYYLVNLNPTMPSELATDQLSDAWKAMLTECQYSYYYDVGANRIAVSNTKSAYYGLPPNSRALRMPLLKTQIIPENCTSPAVGGEVRKRKTKKSKPEKTPAKQTVAENPVAWQPLLKAFLDSPSEASYKALTGCGVAWKHFYAPKPKGGDGFKLSKYAGKRLRSPYVGVDKAMDSSAFAKMIVDKWAEEDQRLMVILKWATLTRWEGGKVFFRKEEEPKKKQETAGLTEETAVPEVAPEE